MQTLLLLSHGKFLANNLPDILGVPTAGLKVVHITTAGKGARVDMSPYWLTVHQNLEGHGCLVDDLDIEGLDEETLRNILKEYQAIFVNGGNVFYLLRAMRACNFEKVLKELLSEGLIYMGASAGAYVACPTIEVAAWDTSRNTFDLTDFSGFNFVPYLIKAHYRPDMIDLIKEKSKTLTYPIRILSDDQAILVKDGISHFLGDNEIKI